MFWWEVGRLQGRERVTCDPANPAFREGDLPASQLRDWPKMAEEKAWPHPQSALPQRHKHLSKVQTGVAARGAEDVRKREEGSPICKKPL